MADNGFTDRPGVFSHGAARNVSGKLAEILVGS
jgi:hypothetical protein